MKFCSLYSGSSGNSIFIASDNTRILIDAGLPGKSIDAALKEINEDPSKIDAIFITHEHSDHIKGVGVISRKYDIPIYTNEATWNSMLPCIGKIKEHNIKIIEKRSVTAIKDIDIISFNTPHDAVGPMGYTLHSKGKRISVATDLGTFTEEVKYNIKDSDIILLESNHDVQMLKYGPYPYPLKRRVLSEIGHLSNEACAEALVNINDESKVRRIILGHLSNTNNYPELAYQTVFNILNENKINTDKDMIISLADRGKPSSYIEI
ncbi:MBL fold metallo-hydrolase [Clostridium polynesiense]|uniref:MBL fold metallo-hydrolase n=1 Tax=Clostridium polynesiense TaxID=1325933 RepID=UPI00058EDE9B|nr:MBL fold metallo-hydrolase [Clostridium polynesiense]